MFSASVVSNGLNEMSMVESEDDDAGWGLRSCLGYEKLFMGRMLERK